MLALIVAHTKNRVIGKGGEIPWKIKREQWRFRELTTGNVVIMGRRSFKEIGKPLPGRYTIVVSKTKKFESENCTTAISLKEALKIADSFGNKDIYIAGGARLYEEAIDLVDVMYITEIDAEVDGDTFFPEFDTEQFGRVEEARVDGNTDTGELPYVYVTYIRKQRKYA